LAATEKLVAILNHLVRAANQIDVIFLQEAFDYRLTKSVADSTVIFPPAGLSFLRV
jgi:hypothetical protein